MKYRNFPGSWRNIETWSICPDDAGFEEFPMAILQSSEIILFVYIRPLQVKIVFTLLNNNCQGWRHGQGWMCNKYLQFTSLIVKLREREGQRVDLGRSLKGHLWMVDGGWWYTFPWCFTLNLVATTTTTTTTFLPPYFSKSPWFSPVWTRWGR